MTIEHLHIVTARGNPGCGEDNHCARLTADPDLVTCPRCKLSATFRTQRKRGSRPVRPPASYAGVAVRAAASLYLRRALKLIEQLPMRRPA